MGWWSENEGGEELLLGDGPFDIAGDAFEQIAREYQEDWGRKPTLAEMLRTLERVLAAVSHLHLQDGGEKEIVSLTAKTRKRKVQSYQVGDFFAIPIDDLYAFGRVLSDAAASDIGYLIGIYDRVSSRLLWPKQLQGAEFMWPPFYCGDFALIEGRWKVIGHLPIQPGEFVYPRHKANLGSRGWYVVEEGNQYCKATEQEVEGLEFQTLNNPNVVERDIRKVLQERGILNA